MLTPGEIEVLSMTFDKQMRTLESQIMTDIIRRIRINGEITRSADWQMHRLQQMGYAKSDIEEAIKKHLNLSDEDMEEMYKKIIEEGYARDTELYNKAGIDRIPFEENYTLQQSISAIALQTSNEMKNISQSLGFAVRNADGSLSFTPAAEYYQSTLDNAINGIAQGVFDYNTAIKRAVSEMTNSGLRTVDYASGWSNRVDVAARRAVMTGLSQLTGKVNDMNAEELGTDTFEVTRHSGARPSHQVWQGKWYTKEELISVCGLGTVTGLHGANCYHNYYPVIPGISEPSYTAEELEELNRQENTPVKYGDKEYTKYEALQRQRRLETTMRAQRQKIKLLKEGGADEDDIIAARARYRGTSAEYTRFSEAMKLPQQRQRVTVDGLGNIGQGKWKKSVDKSGESGIIDIEIDEFVPCLKDAKTGEIRETEVSRIKRSELKKYTERNGWSADWYRVPKDEEVYGVFLKGDTEPQGLISLRNEKGGTYIALAATAPHNNKQIVGDNIKYIGVGGHLFALAVEESVKNGGCGTIYGYAVNQKVLKHYQDKFGATHIPIVHEFQFLIEGEASKKLLKKYNYERRD